MMGDQDFVNSAYIYLLKELSAIRCTKNNLISFHETGWTESLITKIPDLASKLNLSLAKLNAYQKLGIQITNFFSDNYPKALKELSSPPMLLYYYGSLEKYQSPTNNISIIGTRNASIYGQNYTKTLVSNLQGYNIISGLAYGIDSIAHESSINNGLATAAILGCGLLQITAKAHNNSLITSIKNNTENLLLSEFEPEASASKWTFPLRNRIIAALSQTLIVIEAHKASGSLITAREAIKLKRQIYTIPFNWGQSNFAGNQELLSNGQAIIIYDPLNFNKEPSAVTEPSTRVTQHPILEHIDIGPVSFDYLLTALKMTTRELSKELSSLEIQGLITKTTSGRYTKTS